MAAWSAAGAGAGASGFVIGGALTQLSGWRAMFWINLPLALIIAAGVLRCVPRRAAPKPAEDSTCAAGSCSAPESAASSWAAPSCSRRPTPGWASWRWPAA